MPRGKIHDLNAQNVTEVLRFFALHYFKAMAEQDREDPFEGIAVTLMAKKIGYEFLQKRVSGAFAEIRKGRLSLRDLYALEHDDVWPEDSLCPSQVLADVDSEGVIADAYETLVKERSPYDTRLIVQYAVIGTHWLLAAWDLEDLLPRLHGELEHSELFTVLSTALILTELVVLDRKRPQALPAKEWKFLHELAALVETSAAESTES